VLPYVACSSFLTRTFLGGGGKSVPRRKIDLCVFFVAQRINAFVTWRFLSFSLYQSLSPSLFHYLSTSVERESERAHAIVRLSLCMCVFASLSLSLSLSHTHTHSHSITQSLTLSPSFSLSHSLSLSRTHFSHTPHTLTPCSLILKGALPPPQPLFPHPPFPSLFPSPSSSLCHPRLLSPYTERAWCLHYQ